MKDSKKPELNRDENHLVKATVLVNGAEINSVPCKIYLPERIDEKPYLILKPTKEDAKRIMSSYRGGLKASVYGLDKKIQITIETPEVYFSGSSIKQWGDDIYDCTIPGEPQDLHIINHRGDNNRQRKTWMTFWISPNKFLTPFMSSTPFFTGDIKCKCYSKVEFMIKDEVKLVFNEHFHSKTAKNGDLIRWSFLVACAKLNVPASDIETLKKSILPDIDDFLIIASFASRQRTACLGWTANDKDSFTTFYRGNYVFPHADTDTSIHDGIIDIKDFERFMQTGYLSFLQYENKLGLRNALYSIVPAQSGTLETSFLKMFAGLETLILDFKRREALEFVLSDKKDWSDLKDYLHKCLKNSTELKLKSEQRKSIYQKFDELNRVSLREAFDVFCPKYSIYLSDLWPVFGEKKSRIIGLVDIRHKLIHGDPFPPDAMGALVVAKEHLICILERVIVRVLQWNVAETKVNQSYLRNHLNIIKDMPSAQEKLFEYIFGPSCPKAKIPEE